LDSKNIKRLFEELSKPEKKQAKEAISKRCSITVKHLNKIIAGDQIPKLIYIKEIKEYFKVSSFDEIIGI